VVLIAFGGARAARRAASRQGGNGIAVLYPGESVSRATRTSSFVERFEEPALTDLFTRWTDIKSDVTMLFSADVPPRSPGSHSLEIPWIGGGILNGGHLYKVLSPGVETLFRPLLHQVPRAANTAPGHLM